MPSKNRRLFDAIEAGAVSMVWELLDADPSALEAYGAEQPNRLDKTPLMYALQCGHLRLAGELIDRGADVRARMAGGPRSSVVALAVRFVIPGRDLRPMVAVVERLLDGGADPDDALYPACHAYHKAFDQPELIELLLRRGANPERVVGETGSTVRRLVEINARRYSPRVLALFGLAPP
ncbi:MAG: ankyrin repeat domain-containing protein [Proteobacteria bacterium]|nr:ankyrin repeat domain-containing protein [Pseudomonadota bacterium]